MRNLRARAFIKWAGGKQGIASYLVRMFPLEFGRYYEPFIGGGSVLFAAHPETGICGDENDWLIDCYEAIRDDWKGVANILDTLKNTKEDFLKIRETRPDSLNSTERAAFFIYLNKTCFRGLFRVNRQGQFNVPYGAYKRRYYDPGELEIASQVVRKLEFRTGDFELTLSDVKEKDFVYLDPPYYKLGGYSDFNRYTKGQFREKDHIRLAAVCREMDERGVLWAVSNSNTPFIRRLFEGYKMIEVANRREINLNSRDRDIMELLIVNYPVRTQQPSLFTIGTEEESA